MRKMSKLVERFVHDEQGLETVEYAVIAGIIVVTSLAIIASIGGWVNTKFGQLDSGLAANP